MESTHSTPLADEKELTTQNSSSVPTPLDAEKDSASTKQHDASSLSHQVSRQLSNQLSRIETSDYPTGIRLAMIVVALVLTIFLVSLDMVSLLSTELSLRICV